MSNLPLMIGRSYPWMKRRLDKLSENPLAFPFFVLAICAYWFSFFYFFHHQGLRAVGWHTHIVFPITIYVVVNLFVKHVLTLLFKWRSDKFLEKWSYAIWIYSVIEIFILLTGVGRVSNEDQKGQYNAAYETKNASFYHVWKAGSRHWLSNSEFHFERMSNSLGFADREWEMEKPEGTYRILCLGDSFTEGDGSHADSTYPVFLQKMMRDKFGTIEVLNAGTCGSDPYFNFINYKDRLRNYQPDLIIQTISANDLMHDIPMRGGMARFKHNGRLEYDNAPWWEPIYAVSFVFRIFVNVLGYNADLTNNRLIYRNLDSYIYEVHQMIVHEYAAACQEQGSQLIVVYLPMKSELENSSPDIVRGKMSNIFSDSGFIYKDLYPYYMSNLSSRKGSSASDFYWKYDSHHNAGGYELMAKSIYDAMQSILPDSLKMNGL